MVLLAEVNEPNSMTQTVFRCVLYPCQSRYINNTQRKFLGISAGIIFTLLVLFFYESFYTDSSDGKPWSSGATNLVNVQYAVVIDAGSSGSRVFIYVWPPHTGGLHELLQIRPLMDNFKHPIIKKIEPGLSSVAANPSAASDYISPLLHFAADQIPAHLHVETPLYILATAGLRLLNSSQQSSILDDLRSDIPKSFNFSFATTNVEIISGKQEGVYQWIAINYVLGRFTHNTSESLEAVDADELASPPLVFRKKTLGILDMGGASMQIAFEMTHNTQLNSLNSEQRTHLAEFNLGCTEHGLEHLYHTYVMTYLGYGANQVLERYNEHLIRQVLIKHAENATQSVMRVTDPCRPLNIHHSTGENSLIDSSTVIINIVGSGQFDECRNSLFPVLKNLSGCPGASCSLSSLPINFNLMEWYGFSEFWYSMEDILGIGGPYNFYELQKASQDYCGTDWDTLKNRHRRNVYPQADANRLANQCFKIAWITVVLHEGLGLPIDYANLKSSPNTISGQVTHWTLGATLFRTRFFPLGSVQREMSLQHTKSFAPWSLYLNQYLFIGCFLLVISAIVMYLRGLNKWCCRKKRLLRPTRYDVEGQILS